LKNINLKLRTYFPKRNCAATVQISTVHVSVSDLYSIFPQSICLFCSRKICGPIREYMNRSQTLRHMNVEIGTEAAQFPEKEYINGIFVAVYRRLYHKYSLCYQSQYVISETDILLQCSNVIRIFLNYRFLKYNGSIFLFFIFCLYDVFELNRESYHSLHLSISLAILRLYLASILF
jgi:hypothetical protein